ncbi:OPT oligopeptide transporter [Mycena venus]|uniref:OPT oligopeptide transporter n=1 Tax=Mycena venus TaxID=2733690 RepID=A0A8H6X600_9AGAR|nr:OPT oligopeptide transporter [Mycena venus]
MSAITTDDQHVADTRDSMEKAPDYHDPEKGLAPADIEALEAAALPEFDDPNLDKDAAIAVRTPEVRSAVANTDDPTIPCNTLRAWVLGLIWAIIIPGLNQFFFFRYPAVTVTSIVAQLLTFPLGRAWARLLPNVSILGVQLNPGPFTIKEHVIITIMAGVGAGSAYATDIVAVQRVYYDQTFNFGYQWMIVMSTQLIGFSIGGIARRFLVQPPEHDLAVQPRHLRAVQYPACAAVCGGRVQGACWYLVPGYLFTGLSFFSWVCWIKPNNVVVNQLFGVNYGLAMGMVTFDWAQITYIGSPLATPWWAEANIAVGFVFFFWILTPALYVRTAPPLSLSLSFPAFSLLPSPPLFSTPGAYAQPRMASYLLRSVGVSSRFTNTFYSKYMPISSGGSFDNTGASYNVSRILTPDKVFDEQKYKEYSPIFLSTTFSISYGLSFASITATITHAFLFFRKQIWTQSRRAMHEQPDIHARLMAVYPQVPEWWYAIIFITMFVFGIVAIEVWDTKFPVQFFILALVISFVYVIPIGMIQAITNQQVGLNVITELIIGYALPGRPVAMMMFKTWGYITMAQALTFTSDFKLGHYMKIPPRHMFTCQVVATVVAGTVQLGVQAWMFTNIEGMCDRDQKDGFWCPSTGVFGTASIIWGVIGPARQFSHGQIYYALTFFFLIGFLCPLIAWLCTLKWPNSWLRYLKCLPRHLLGHGPHPPPPTRTTTSPGRSSGSSSSMLSGGATLRGGQSTTVRLLPSFPSLPFPSLTISYTPTHADLASPTDVLSAALDSGVAVSAVLIFFILQYPRNGTIGLNTIQSWWGNTVWLNTADGNKTPLISLADGETFGPSTW